MSRLLDAFRDKSRRPRTIIWLWTVTFGLAAFVLVAIGATSTNWFCANICHEIQDDTINAFNRSAHANYSCLECHMPVNANVGIFMIHKVEVGVVGLYQKVTKTFELPLNPESELALTMNPNYCTQCHKMDNREVTPSKGIIINHKAHADAGVTCPQCHNRVAHPDPVDNKFVNAGMKAHPNFMEMKGCNRCHGLEKTAKAPGTCPTCHPKDFELKPASHLTPAFYNPKSKMPSGVHASLAESETVRIEEVEKTLADKPKEGGTEGEKIMNIEEVRLCGQCHDEKTFCTGCHGVEVPHPASFVKDHGKLGREKPASCQKCHEGGLPPKTITAAPTPVSFCDSCHHPKTGDKPWIPQHFKVVKQDGAKPCLKCHQVGECERCHVRMVMKAK